MILTNISHGSSEMFFILEVMRPVRKRFRAKIKFNAFDWLFLECILFRSKLELETQVELTLACVFSFMLGSD